MGTGETGGNTYMISESRLNMLGNTYMISESSGNTYMISESGLKNKLNILED